MKKQIKENDQTQFSVSMNQVSKTNSSEEKKRYSVLGIVATFILIIIIIMFGERLIFDVNRILNPVINHEYTDWKNSQKMKSGYSSEVPEMFSPSSGMEMAIDSSRGAISATKIYYLKSEKSRYLMYELIIHAAIIIPVFVLAFALFYFKKESHSWRPIVIGFVIAGFWLMLHLLGETMSFVMDAYKNIAIYIILVILALLFGGLTLYAQSRYIGSRKE